MNCLTSGLFYVFDIETTCNNMQPVTTDHRPISDDAALRPSYTARFACSPRNSDGAPPPTSFFLHSLYSTAHPSFAREIDMCSESPKRVSGHELLMVKLNNKEFSYGGYGGYGCIYTLFVIHHSSFCGIYRIAANYLNVSRISSHQTCRVLFDS